jgi:hypothetical protein
MEESLCYQFRMAELSYERNGETVGEATKLFLQTLDMGLTNAGRAWGMIWVRSGLEQF